jgi:hypothetical protein
MNDVTNTRSYMWRETYCFVCVCVCVCVCGIVRQQWSGHVIGIRNKACIHNFDGEISSEMLICKTQKALRWEVGFDYGR